jgi:hypothetical protein
VVRLVFTEAELVLVNNALNEVCNGLAIEEPEFATRLGADRETAERLLQEIGNAFPDNGS